ncbi:sugar phosphate isomerase/epimerase family protein [Rhizobium skierniewicense]|uniref:sugar phosphate isomerase/epimerase family protein n=1 Tax=Rhizobium skierniewicense TaxID=984260 RepID=UPI001AEEE007|nr:sugar phosphate isomerase/epimerase family protein [Rhizobium skierniewicense]NTF35051.1 sugar phosphate isomerase/epimerase [Rhizobium skierniewicense]
MTEIVFNHATVRERADMLAFLRLSSDRGLKTVSVWGDEIAKIGEADALSALDDYGMTISGYNRMGPFTPEYLDRAEAELERAARFGADHVFVFTGGLLENEKNLDAARSRVEDTFGRLLDMARKIGIKLAIEPLHPMLAGDRTVITSLSHANALAESLGPGIGVVVDVYHVWWDERLAVEIERAGRAGRLLGFHVNDWLVPTRHLLTDRGMMGDGIIDLPGIEGMVRRAGFKGPVEVEIFSTDWWSRDPGEVMDIAIDRCRQLFGQEATW